MGRVNINLQKERNKALVMSSDRAKTQGRPQIVTTMKGQIAQITKGLPVSQIAIFNSSLPAKKRASVPPIKNYLSALTIRKQSLNTSSMREKSMVKSTVISRVTKSKVTDSSIMDFKGDESTQVSPIQKKTQKRHTKKDDPIADSLSLRKSNGGLLATVRVSSAAPSTVFKLRLKGEPEKKKSMKVATGGVRTINVVLN